jgi:putative two-component system response regulator
MTDPNPTGPGRLGRAIRAGTDQGARRVLVVDDEDAIRNALARFLATRDFEVSTADTAAAALEALENEHFVALLLDVRMPGMTGVELVPKALHRDTDLAIIMLTAVNDAPTATEALALGAMDYLTKPVELEALASAIERALRRRQNQIEQRKFEWLIREEVAARTEELRAEREMLSTTVVDVVRALVTAQEAKDAYLRGHSDRVADLAASIASTLGLPDEKVEAIRLGGKVMDVGKIALRESVLNKPGALTAEEFDHVKTHVKIGVDILSPIKPLAHLVPIVAHHHEHFDGSGYPHGLSGEAISLGGRILAAADAFDALTSQRAWREPLTPDAAMDAIEQRGVTLLDPKVLQALKDVVGKRKTLSFLDPAKD